MIILIYSPNGQWYIVSLRLVYLLICNPYCRNRQYSYVYVCIGYIYLTKYDLMLYHPSYLFLTPPWGARIKIKYKRAHTRKGCKIMQIRKIPTETQGKYENASAPLYFSNWMALFFQIPMLCQEMFIFLCKFLIRH